MKNPESFLAGWTIKLQKEIMTESSSERDARETLRRGFDELAALYHRARPRYPEQVFDDLFELGKIGPGARVLEIGCGTGQASRPLAQRGCRLTCVELGERHQK